MRFRVFIIGFGGQQSFLEVKPFCEVAHAELSSTEALPCTPPRWGRVPKLGGEREKCLPYPRWVIAGSAGATRCGAYAQAARGFATVVRGTPGAQGSRATCCPHGAPAWPAQGRTHSGFASEGGYG